MENIINRFMIVENNVFDFVDIKVVQYIQPGILRKRGAPNKILKFKVLTRKS